MLFGLGKSADEDADATGIDHRNFGEIDDETVLAFAHETEAGLTQPIYRIAQFKIAAQLDHVDVIVGRFAHVDFQASLLISALPYFTP